MDLEGSLVLERLAAIGKLEEFYEAADNDDFAAARALMLQADLDLETIEATLAEMRDTEGTHSARGS